MAFVVAALVGLAGAAWAFSRVRPDFRARTRVERVVMGTLLVASLIAIVTTFGIVASLLLESIRFFQSVSPFEFLFGTNWSRSEEHTSELQSLMRISYAVFCLK